MYEHDDAAENRHEPADDERPDAPDSDNPDTDDELAAGKDRARLQREIEKLRAENAQRRIKARDAMNEVERYRAEEQKRAEEQRKRELAAMETAERIARLEADRKAAEEQAAERINAYRQATANRILRSDGIAALTAYTGDRARAEKLWPSLRAEIGHLSLPDDENDVEFEGGAKAVKKAAAALAKDLGLRSSSSDEEDTKRKRVASSPRSKIGGKGRTIDVGGSGVNQSLTDEVLAAYREAKRKNS